MLTCPTNTITKYFTVHKYSNILFYIRTLAHVPLDQYTCLASKLGQANSIRSLLVLPACFFVHTLQLSYFIMITCFNSKIRVVNSVMYL